MTNKQFPNNKHNIYYGHAEVPESVFHYTFAFLAKYYHEFVNTWIILMLCKDTQIIYIYITSE